MARNCDLRIQRSGCHGRCHLAVCNGVVGRGSGNSADESTSNVPETTTPAMQCMLVQAHMLFCKPHKLLYQGQERNLPTV